MGNCQVGKIKHLKNILLIAQKNLLGKPPPFPLIVKSLQSTLRAEKMTLLNIVCGTNKYKRRSRKLKHRSIARE